MLSCAPLNSVLDLGVPVRLKDVGRDLAALNLLSAKFSPSRAAILIAEVPMVAAALSVPPPPKGCGGMIR